MLRQCEVLSGLADPASICQWLQHLCACHGKALAADILLAAEPLRAGAGREEAAALAQVVSREESAALADAEPFKIRRPRGGFPGR